MNQIFSFKEFLVEAVLKGEKTHTTREWTPYRAKCGKGDTMYIYSKIRTKEAKKFGEGIVLNTYIWETYLPIKCPIPDLKYDAFALKEGFDEFEDLKKFFTKKYITYHFKLKE